MLKLNIFKRITFLNKLHSNKILKKHYFVYCSFASGAFLTWCACEGRSNETETGKDGSILKVKKRLQLEYNDRILHSSIVRFGRAAVAVVSVFTDYKYSLMGLDAETEKYKRLKSECHLRSAIKFRNLCSSNGGVFMKVAQHIGSLDFLFPAEYTETLKCFQYEAPSSSFEDVSFVIETDTKQRMEELFSSFEQKPIGSASLAQVHKATLKNGEMVAVKVQHRTVKEHAFADAKVIEFFVNIATKMFPEFRFHWLVDQIKANLPLELDFLNEGKNCEKMGDILKDFKYLKVPQIYWKESTERVLFMEFCHGGVVDDLEYIRKNKIDVNDISTKLGRLYSEMIFVHGFIHCDPHPGNILVRKSEKDSRAEIILLDHGLYQTMDDDIRLAYCKLWQSMMESNVNGIKKYSEALNVGKYYNLFACIVAGRTWNSIQHGIDKKDLTAEELQEVQENAIRYITNITEVLELLPREMILIFKTNDLLRGLDGRLKTKATSGSFVTMAQCCLRAVYSNDMANTDSMVTKWRLSCTYAINNLRLLTYRFSLSPIGQVLVTILDQFKRSIDKVTNHVFVT